MLCNGKHEIFNIKIIFLFIKKHEMLKVHSMIENTLLFTASSRMLIQLDI